MCESRLKAEECFLQPVLLDEGRAKLELGSSSV